METVPEDGRRPGGLGDNVAASGPAGRDPYALERRIPAFLRRNVSQAEAAEIAAMEREEIDLYRRYHEWFSYGFYIVRKR